MMPKDLLSFEGRVAIVTGAGRGLGRAYALELARRGAKVVVNDLATPGDQDPNGSDAPADRVVAEIRDAGGAAIAVHQDAATPAGGERIVRAAVDAFGKVDTLINNAGILRDRSLPNLTPDEWNQVIAVNLTGAYCVSRPAFKVMKGNRYGRIVLTTSAAAIFGNFGQSNYAAAKLGLIGLMNILKIEGAGHGIKVNTISPAAVTRLTRDFIAAELAEKQTSSCVVPLVVYLCSEQATESGNVYYAGMGAYRRIALVSGAGTLLGNADHPASPEDIMAHMDRINSLETPRVFATSADFAEDVYRSIGYTPQK